MLHEAKDYKHQECIPRFEEKKFGSNGHKIIHCIVIFKNIEHLVRYENYKPNSLPIKKTKSGGMVNEKPSKPSNWLLSSAF